MNCRKCRSSLAGKTYVEHDGANYCEHCYKWNIADKCEECRKPIEANESNLKVKEKHYHKDCLTCGKCRKSLDGQSFAVVDGKMICGKCRGVATSSYCIKCNKDFRPEDKKIGGKDGKHFHEQCFRCLKCDRAIGTEKFVRQEDGNVICARCSRANAECCAKCRMQIDDQLVRFDEKPYHPECFVCGQCRNSLSGREIFEHNDKNFCEPCYTKHFSNRCASCLKAIKGAVKFTEYGGKHYHSECFACVTCHTPLVGLKFVNRDEKFICVNCK